MSQELDQIVADAKSQARKELFKAFVDKNQKIIIQIAVVAFAVVLVAIIAQAILSYSHKKYSAQLHQALVNEQLGKIDEAVKSYKELSNTSFTSGSIKALAGLRYSAFLIAQNKNSEAVKVYEEVAKCLACDKYLKNLSALLAVKTLSSMEREIEAKVILKKVADLESSASVLRNQISFERAVLEMKIGDKNKARQIFDLLVKSTESSAQVKEKSQNYLGLISSEDVVVEAKEKSSEQKAAEENSAKKSEKK